MVLLHHAPGSITSAPARRVPVHGGRNGAASTGSPFMKQLLNSFDPVSAGLSRSVLETAGIACEVRNESMSQVMPGVAFAPELWVSDEDFEEAKRLLATTPSEGQPGA